jgi:hypothetical protein
MLNFEMKKGRRFRCTSDMSDVVNPPEGVPPLSQPSIDFSNGLPLIDASNCKVLNPWFGISSPAHT